MKTLEIQIEGTADLEKIKKLLRSTLPKKDIRIFEKKSSVDPISLASQECLGEEWNSEEDSRWDSLL